MTTNTFTDKITKPDEVLVKSTLGEYNKYWNELKQCLTGNYKNVVLEWKYYADAKGWLLPVAIGKKNYCWITFAEDTFRMSFWFGKKLELAVEKSDLPENIMELYRKAEQNKMGRGISIFVRSKTDLEDALRLFEFRYSLK